LFDVKNSLNCPKKLKNNFCQRQKTNVKMDRNLHKSDKKLANQGWNAMRRALDQEMPEERRRRPVALFWILALLAPTAGLLGWLMFGPSNNSPMPAGNLPVATAPALSPADSGSSTAQIPEADMLTQTPDRLTNGIQSESLSNNIQSERQIQVKEPKNKQNTGKAREANKTTVRKGGISPEKNTIAAISSEHVTPTAGKQPESDNNSLTINDLFVSHAAQATGITAPEVAENAEPPSLSETTDAAVTAVTPSQIVNTNPALSVADSVSEAPFAMPPAPIDPLRHAEKQTWVFGANTGIFSDTRGSYAGAGAGLSAEWQPLKKWGVRSGVGYQYRQLGTEERPIVSLSPSDYVVATGDVKVASANSGLSQTPVASQDNSATPVFVPVSRLHRVEMPVLAFWQPVSKLRIFGGVAVGNNLYAETGDRSLNKNVVYDIQNGASNRNLNKEVTGQVRTWDMRWSLGLGFKPTRHLELDIFFQKPFEPGRKQDYLEYADFLDSFNTTNNTSTSRPGLNTNALFSLAASWLF
jgi:hypothetical protein